MEKKCFAIVLSDWSTISKLAHQMSLRFFSLKKQANQKDENIMG